MELLPVFVYGTLRSGQGNYGWCLRGRTVSEVRATFAGGRMYDQGGFPYVVQTGDSRDLIVGDLMVIDPDLYATTMASLDGLEGFRGEGAKFNHYDRRIVTVTTDDGVEHRAYTYLVPERRVAETVENLPLIPSGDWVEHDESRPVGGLFMRA